MASRRDKELAELKAELAREQSRIASQSFTVENLCGGYQDQADALNELILPGRYRGAWMTTRRAGKTTGAGFALGLLANAYHDWNLNFIGLSKDHAREVILEESFLPLCEQYKLRAKPYSTNQEVKFLDTGSSVRFFGSDDKTHIKKNLGKRIDVAVVDECQDQPYLKELVQKILGPALQDSGEAKLLLCGTRPESPAHFFWKLFKSGKYKTRSFKAANNPHLADFQGELAKFLEENQLTIDSPMIQSDWLGNFNVWDESKTPFGYRESINRHQLRPASWMVNPDSIVPGKMLACQSPGDIEWFSIGIDPGSGDRWAVVLWGWSKTRCYQIAEWVTPPNSNVTTWDPVKEVLDLWHAHYSPIVKVYRDAGSTKDTTELFGKFMRRYVLAAAKKSDRRTQVERFSTYLQRGVIQVIPESALEQDLVLARWSKKRLEEGKYEWDNTAIHPDVADAGRYGLQGYFELLPEKPKKVLTPQEYIRRDADEAFRQMFLKAEERKLVPVKQERDSSSIWGGPDRFGGSGTGR